jgi:hypothetical protein
VYKLWVILLFLFFNIAVRAADRSYVTVQVFHNVLDNISHDPETTPVSYLSNNAFHLNYQVRQGWDLQIIYGKADNYNFAGGGFRIHTPGVFLFPNKDLVPKGKRRSPVNASVHAELLRMFDQTDPSVGTNYYSSRAGFTLDLVPNYGSKYFLSLDTSVWMIRSDMQISYGIGSGFEF